MFTTLVVQPIFNLLALIIALLPGHNFGVAIIIFTLIIRMMLWPLLKKQLHNAKAMRELQPEIKRIKKETAGDRAKESQLTMELYKEREINPFSSIGVLLIQLPILLGLYAGLRKIVADPHALYTFTYPFVRNLSYLKELAAGTATFDHTFLGFIDLTKAAFPKTGGFYFPGFVLVIGSAITQYFQSVQLMPVDKDARKLRDILKDAGKGTQADSGEVNAAVARGTRFLIPIMIFLVTLNIASALSLYWFVGGLIAIFQQGRILRDDTEELEASVRDPKPGKGSSKKDLRKIVEAEIVQQPKKATSAKSAPVAAPVEVSKKARKSTVTKVTKLSDTAANPAAANTKHSKSSARKAKKRRR